MTDKELIELAAKAAGAKWHFNQLDHPAGWRINDIPWNPLTDDGDALRLAVKLRLEINLMACEIVVCPVTQGQIVVVEPNDDPYTATRRAIVRAAAEIGKGMK